jgi:hypothetical protein
MIYRQVICIPNPNSLTSPAAGSSTLVAANERANTLWKTLKARKGTATTEQIQIQDTSIQYLSGQTVNAVDLVSRYIYTTSMSQNVQVDFNPNRENISYAHVGCGTNLRNDIFENARILGGMTFLIKKFL